MKKILSILLIFIIVFSFSINVFAEEEEQQEEVNEYYLEFLASSSKTSSTINYKGVYCDFIMKFTNKKIVGFYDLSSDSCAIEYYVYDSSGNLNDCGSFLYNIAKYCSYSGSYKTGKYSYESNSVFWIEVEGEGNGYSGRTHWNTVKLEDSGYIKTNIPLFSDEETARAFINGTVDISQAENFESDILNIVEDSSEVPMPRNLHIEYEDYCYYIVWEYSSEDLKKLSLVSINGMPMEIKARLKNVGDYLYCPIAEELDSCIELDEYLEPRLSYKLDITDDIARLRDGIENKLGTKFDYQATIDYWILSRWDKSELDRYFSNFAHVKLYISDSDEGFKVDFDTSVTDSQNNVLDDVIFDSGIDIGTDSSNFIGNITNLFGLLGENGFLSCCKAIFSCFPSFVWDLISGGLSAALVVFLIKLLFK